MSCSMDGWSSTGKDFLSLPNFQKRPIPLRKTAGNNRKPLTGFDEGCDKLGIAQFVVLQLLWECKIQKHKGEA